VARDKDSQNDELTAMLAAGNFEQTGIKVIGTWPVQKSLLEALTAGL
jgi:hypothetical protein